MLLLDLRNQLELDKYNWEDVHYYGTILDTSHQITKYWTETGTSDVTHGGKAPQLGRAERFGGGGGVGDCVVEMSQFKIMPIVSCFKRLSIYIYLYSTG